MTTGSTIGLPVSQGSGTKVRVTEPNDWCLKVLKKIAPTAVVDRKRRDAYIALDSEAVERAYLVANVVDGCTTIFLRLYAGNTQHQAQAFYSALDPTNLLELHRRDENWGLWPGLHFGYIQQHLLDDCTPSGGIGRYLRFWKDETIAIKTVWKRNFRNFLSQLRREGMAEVSEIHQLKKVLDERNCPWMSMKPGVTIAFEWPAFAKRLPDVSTFAPQAKAKMIEALEACSQPFVPRKGAAKNT